MDDGLKRIAFEVYGKVVQGVGFRKFVERMANQHRDLTGFVYNTSVGTVKGQAQGPSISLRRFNDSLKVGSRHSSVDRVAVTYIDIVTDEATFSILRQH
ncbi:Acylphosphatase-like domain-containing protein [Lipomyces arxii]|uniref:Acylphosphatase-like domain-containing protein n=1 Tax=Lipomyces arxii TaxID=56418 RepID=UPI0034CE0362